MPIECRNGVHPWRVVVDVGVAHDRRCSWRSCLGRTADQAEGRNHQKTQRCQTRSRPSLTVTSGVHCCVRSPASELGDVRQLAQSSQHPTAETVGIGEPSHGADQPLRREPAPFGHVGWAARGRPRAERDHSTSQDDRPTTVPTAITTVAVSSTAGTTTQTFLRRFIRVPFRNSGDLTPPVTGSQRLGGRHPTDSRVGVERSSLPATQRWALVLDPVPASCARTWRH